MFQKMMYEAGAMARTSEMDKVKLERRFECLRRRQAARKNRSTADHGMFCRRNPAYRHV